VIQSVDSEALNRFEDHLRLIAGLGESPAVPPVVFYLKYATADEATRMLADLLDGTTWVGGSSGGTLVNGIVSPRTTRGFWGSLVLSREGTTTMTAGSATVVADARLNRLIVQGTAQDISLIESYLKVIDKDSSITAVETHGRSHVVELFHTEASEVAAVIREAYAGRIANATSSNTQRNTQQPAGGDGKSDQSKEQSEESKGRGEEGRRTASKPTRNRDPEMTVAVHEASNSLIITAPDQLFAEVEQLVRLVDKRAEQAVEVVIPHTLNGRYVGEVLQDVLLGRRDRERGNEPRSAREATDSRRNREKE
jgi:alpha/beta superfamily hydrolase